MTFPLIGDFLRRRFFFNDVDVFVAGGGVNFSDPKVPKPNPGIKMVPIPSSSVGF